jgi:hypothetical protein
MAEQSPILVFDVAGTILRVQSDIPPPSTASGFTDPASEDTAVEKAIVASLLIGPRRAGPALRRPNVRP